MEQKGVVSIIIPTYGGGDSLKRCVDSALEQTYKEIEVVVVDDNGLGTENQLSTAQVMAQYEDDPRVRYVCHEHNINGAAARNTGVKNSNGEYIALLDDDDIFLPNNIEEHMKVLPNLSNEYALTYCSGIDDYCNGKVRYLERTFSGQNLYDLLMHKIEITSTALVIRRSVWDELGGFDESFRRHQDWEFSARVMAKYHVMALSNFGYKRFRYRRNVPNPEVARNYMTHYLSKMDPYIKMLPKTQQKDVIIRNRMFLVLKYIKRKKYIRAFVEFMRIGGGIRGIKWLYRKL
ncbi:MAG: glycosyltransferase family 2 protein [Paludibacteraceae bacterium]|nr:glycosyltransferase family 2 protein [Paludibacteraceae bacterium]